MVAPPRLADPPTEAADLDVWTVPANERITTPATLITFARTIASVTLSGVAIHQHSLKLLVIALLVFWIGDSVDGQVARRAHCESRIGATLDILSDRFCAAAFYLGLAWIHPEYAAAVLVYLGEYMVIDCFSSLAFLAWPIRSSNYFWVIDRRIWRLNWSHPGKAVNSGLFAILLLVTHNAWLGLGVACCLFAFKCWTFAKLLRLGLPVPARHS